MKPERYRFYVSFHYADNGGAIHLDGFKLKRDAIAYVEEREANRRELESWGIPVSAGSFVIVDRAKLPTVDFSGRDYCQALRNTRRMGG